MPFVLRLTPTVKLSNAELVQSHLWSAGTTGTSELPSGEIIAGFDEESVAQQVGRTINDQLAGPGWVFTVEEVDPTTWEPFTKITSVTVATRQGPLKVEIEAEQVFGHGKHPTTQLMLESLGRTVDVGDSVLDVGTGSGVLGIAAAMLGATVEAIDIDEKAISSALHNARQNNVEIECSTKPLADVAAQQPQRFDVVVINVLLPVHVQLHQEVLHAVAPGGKVLMAGFLDSQELAVHELYQPFKLVDKTQILDWVGLTVVPTS